jgi:phosphohistidine swiveling domain-containing protein
MGIGNEPYEGQARLLVGAGEGFESFEPGDVLIAPMTSPTYNVVLALAGALVTEEGDAMSHAAIMARELGIPAVIGAPEVTRRISDGDRVLVDPLAGRITLLAEAGAKTPAITA